MDVVYQPNNTVDLLLPNGEPLVVNGNSHQLMLVDGSPDARVKTLAVDNGVHTKPVQEIGGQNQDIAAYAQELSALVEELADMGNTRSVTGEYIFAGTGGDQPAVALDEASGDYQLQGGEVREAQISDAQSVELGVALKDVLGSDDDNILNALSQFAEVASDPNVTEPKMDVAIAGALEAIDGAMDRVNQSLTGVGASLNSLKMAEDSQTGRKTFNETMQGGLENVDVARATMDFAMQQQQLMASQKAYSMVNSTSLFDYV